MTVYVGSIVITKNQVQGSFKNYRIVQKTFQNLSDINFGFLMDLTSRTGHGDGGKECQGEVILREQAAFSQAAQYAIELASKEYQLPKNLKFGFVVLDVCESSAATFLQSAAFIANCSTSKKCPSNHNLSDVVESFSVVGVVDLLAGDHSLMSASVLSAGGIPVVNSFTSEPLLSKNYPGVLRISPPSVELDLIPLLLAKMKWTFISILYEQGSFYYWALQELQRGISNNNIIVALERSLRQDLTESSADNVVGELVKYKESGATVVLLIASARTVKAIFKANGRHSSKENFIWVGIENWIRYKEECLLDPILKSQLVNTLFVVPARYYAGSIEFETWFQQRTMESTTDPWFREVWKKKHCKSNHSCSSNSTELGEHSELKIWTVNYFLDAVNVIANATSRVLWSAACPNMTNSTTISNLVQQMNQICNEMESTEFAKIIITRFGGEITKDSLADSEYCITHIYYTRLQNCRLHNSKIIKRTCLNQLNDEHHNEMIKCIKKTVPNLNSADTLKSFLKDVTSAMDTSVEHLSRPWSKNCPWSLTDEVVTRMWNETCPQLITVPASTYVKRKSLLKELKATNQCGLSSDTPITFPRDDSKVLKAVLQVQQQGDDLISIPVGALKDGADLNTFSLSGSLTVQNVTWNGSVDMRNYTKWDWFKIVFPHFETPIKDRRNVTNPKMIYSTCTPDCEPHYEKDQTRAKQKGCHVCTKCSVNKIVTDFSCETCNESTWPDEFFKSCVDIPPNFESYWNSSVMITMGLLSLLIVFMVGKLVIQHREKRVIKATSLELSMLILFGNVLGFSNLLLFPLPATDSVCITMDVFVDLSFSLRFGALLIRMFLIFSIFRSQHGAARGRHFLGSKQQQIGFCPTVATGFVATTLFRFALTKNFQTTKKLQPDPLKQEVFVHCDVIMDIESLIKDINLLSIYDVASFVIKFTILLVCLLLAFQTRNVPDNFNESGFIFVVTCAEITSEVFVCIISAAASHDRNRIKEKTRLFQSCLSQYVFMFLMFLPKIFIAIFVEPFQSQKNNIILQSQSSYKASRVRKWTASSMQASTSDFQEFSIDNIPDTETRDQASERRSLKSGTPDESPIINPDSAKASHADPDTSSHTDPDKSSHTDPWTWSPDSANEDRLSPEPDQVSVKSGLSMEGMASLHSVVGSLQHSFHPFKTEDPPV
jgi:hypothetical protein